MNIEDMFYDYDHRELEDGCVYLVYVDTLERTELCLMITNAKGGSSHETWMTTPDGGGNSQKAEYRSDDVLSMLRLCSVDELACDVYKRIRKKLGD